MKMDHQVKDRKFKKKTNHHHRQRQKTKFFNPSSIVKTSSYSYIILVICLLLILDYDSSKLVNGQLEAVGAVLSVVPVTSILATAGIVGVKLAALSRLLQALGYDQAYLAKGGQGTAAHPIGLQTNYAYMFPYVPGLNISVKGESGTKYQNMAAHQKEAYSTTRKTYPAMGLPGDYETQSSPFRGAETLREIFRDSGIDFRYPTTQQQQQIFTKGNQKQKIPHNYNNDQQQQQFATTPIYQPNEPTHHHHHQLPPIATANNNNNNNNKPFVNDPNAPPQPPLSPTMQPSNNINPNVDLPIFGLPSTGMDLNHHDALHNQPVTPGHHQPVDVIGHNDNGHNNHDNNPQATINRAPSTLNSPAQGQPGQPQTDPMANNPSQPSFPSPSGSRPTNMPPSSHSNQHQPAANSNHLPSRPHRGPSPQVNMPHPSHIRPQHHNQPMHLLPPPPPQQQPLASAQHHSDPSHSVELERKPDPPPTPPPVDTMISIIPPPPTDLEPPPTPPPPMLRETTLPTGSISTLSSISALAPVERVHDFHPVPQHELFFKLQRERPPPAELPTGHIFSGPVSTGFLSRPAKNFDDYAGFIFGAREGPPQRINAVGPAPSMQPLPMPPQNNQFFPSSPATTTTATILSMTTERPTTSTGPPPSELTTNIIPIELATEQTPPWHDELDNNEIDTGMKRRRRKRDLNGKSNDNKTDDAAAKKAREASRLSDLIMPSSPFSSSLSMEQLNHNQQQQHQLDQHRQYPPNVVQSMHNQQQPMQQQQYRETKNENFGMPALNIHHTFRKRRRRRSLSKLQ